MYGKSKADGEMRIQSQYEQVGMLLDLSVCIGCRACQVACKEWNELPIELTEQSGSYENPKALSGTTWKQVKFLEQPASDQPADPSAPPEWLFYSDSCKHCAEAPCLTACPTGAIFRTQDGIVLINEEVCNGNGHCVGACPFHVVGLREDTGIAGKCTFCYERVDAGLETACAQVCPTDCIEFGERAELVQRAHRRVGQLSERGVPQANLYGETELGGLSVIYVLTQTPQRYGLPSDPRTTTELLLRAALATTGIVLLFLGIYAVFRVGAPAT